MTDGPSVARGSEPSAATIASDWVPFSSRYGLVKEPLGREHWTARHSDHGIIRFGCCPPKPRTACACPGSAGERQCCERATAEDLLCDACRKHCWGYSDARHHYVRLIDAYGPAKQGASGA